MAILLNNFTPNGIINSVPSKSYAHRLIILSSLCRGKTIIKNVGQSKDVNATIDCMIKLGATIYREGENLVVYGIEEPKNKAILDFNESGSTMRFLLPIVGALKVGAEFTGKQSLLSRPNDALYTALSSNGVKVENNIVSGNLLGGEIEIDCSLSSQFISGLILALPLLNKKSTIILKGNLVSKNYILMTIDTAKMFGLKCKFKKNRIEIPAINQYKSRGEYTVEGDWSSAAFPLCLGAIGGTVGVKGLNLKSLQGDRKILSVLKKMNGKIHIKKGVVYTKKSTLKGANVDVSQIIDLAPVISVLCAYAKGESNLFGVSRLKAKESDRLFAIMENLRRAEIKTECNLDTLKIIGSTVKGGDFLGFNDHRIVMSNCVLSSSAVGSSSTTDAQAVDKSYKEFFNHFNQLGGEVNVNI